MKIGEALSGSFRILRERSISLLPMAILVALLSVSLGLKLYVLAGRPYLLAIFVLSIIILVSSIFIYGMYPSMVRDHIDEKELNLKDSLRFSYHKFWSLLGAYLLAGLAIIAAALLIGVPLGLLFSRTNSPVVMLGVIIAAAIAAVLVAAIFCYTCPAIIMEDVRAMQGLERSIEIARENYSFTLSIFLIAAVITCAIDGIFVGLPIFLGVEYYTPILLSILYFPIALLITTWMAIIFPYAYHEIRT